MQVVVYSLLTFIIVIILQLHSGAHLPFMIAEDQVGRVNPLIVQRYLLRVEFQFEDSSIQREAG